MVLSWLFPSRCPVCDAPGPAPCAPCAASLHGPDPIAPLTGVDDVGALFRYDGVARELLLALKYGNRRDVVGWLAEQLASAAPHPVDVITWAPTSPARRRHRGFDQAEVLARATARMLGRPAQALLCRGGSLPQTGRSAHERRTAPAFAPRHRARRRPTPLGHALLIDDIGTTGATLAAAGQALRLAGAARVSALVVAWTPKPSATARAGVAS